MQDDKLTKTKQKLISAEEKTPSEKIIDEIFSDSKSILTDKEAKEKLQWLIDMLTPLQRIDVLKKIERCKYYIERKAKGMDDTKIRSLISRNFDIDRRRLSDACTPCEVRYKNMPKDKI